MNTGDQFVEETVVAPGTVVSANGNTALSGYGVGTAMRAQLVVTAKTGTNPTLDVVIEDSMDGTNWSALGSFTQKTDVAVEAISIIAPLASHVRVRWTIGGTASPSFTFGLKWIVK